MEWDNFLSGKKEVYREERFTSNEKRTFTIFDDGSLLAESEPHGISQKFFRLSEKIRSAKDIQTKLAACEESYKILGAFIQDYMAESTRLPDSILCRDVGVELYQRLGEWDKARAAIEKCAEAGAYPDGGHAAFDYLEKYRHAAETALAFLRTNHGFSQKNLYGALPEVDRECLKSFTRSSLLIRKEKSGGTNKLYAK